MQSYLEKQELIPGDAMLKPFQALMILGMVLEQVTGGWKQHYSDSALGSSSVVLFTSDVKSKQNHTSFSATSLPCVTAQWLKAIVWRKGKSRYPRQLKVA